MLTTIPAKASRFIQLNPNHPVEGLKYAHRQVYKPVYDPLTKKCVGKKLSHIEVDGVDRTMRHFEKLIFNCRFSKRGQQINYGEFMRTVLQ